jgi:hypothetical protein
MAGDAVCPVGRLIAPSVRGAVFLPLPLYVYTEQKNLVASFQTNNFGCIIQ